MSDIEAGQKIGQYQIVEKIGQGSLATVYKAYQPAASRHVAIKILPRELARKPAIVRRFDNETSAVMALEHPHIVPVYDFGAQGGLLYTVMRLIEGGNLTGLMNRPQRLPYRQIVKIVSQVAGALAYAHSQRIVHRDVRPNNILMEPDQTALLSDFGLAKVMQNIHSAQVTETGTILEAASYIAPERVTDKKIDGRSDIYSLGVILYELLTGVLPFQGDNPMATAIQHVKAPIPSLRAIDPDIPAPFEQIVNKALAKWSEHRYQTAEEMEQALQQALEQL